MAEESFCIVKSWLDNNWLEINSVKTNYIHIGIQKSIHLNNYKTIAYTNNCINNNIKKNVCKCNALNRVNSVKYLGIFIVLLINVIVLKMNTVFGQQSPRYKFIQFCSIYNLNIHNFNSYIMYKNV